MVELTAREKLSLARIKLQKDNPFFSHLTMSLDIKEDCEIDSCGVDYKGNMFFNPSWIDKLSNDECKTLLSHEVLHICLNHLTRRGKRDHKIFNVSTDMIINNLLVNEGFVFGKMLSEGILPYNNVYKNEMLGIEITELDKKFAEEVYSLIYDKFKKKNGGGQGEGKEGKEKSKDKQQGEGQGNEGKKPKQDKGFDKHIYSEENISEEEREKAEREWTNKLTEAIVYAKQQGKLPKGIERYADKLMDSKLNWRQMLYKMINEGLPFDYNYNVPSKRSHSLGIYMPRMRRESIDVVIAIDTSGSITQGEINEVMSEINGMANSFESVKFNVFAWDTKLQNHTVVDTYNKGEIEKINLKGGGGTDFTGIYDTMEEKGLQSSKLLVFFTDACATFPKDELVKTLWILTPSGNENNIPYGEVIKL